MMRRTIFSLSSSTVVGVGTHSVFNQAAILEDFDPHRSNARMVDALKHFNGGDVSEFAKWCGSATAQKEAAWANNVSPTFTPFDLQGRRIDSVEFIPAYHTLLAKARSLSVPSLPYEVDPTTGVRAVRGSPERRSKQVTRCALSMLHYQLEQGTGCPLTMTYAGAPVLEQALLGANATNPDGTARIKTWLDKLTAKGYDSTDAFIDSKSSVMMGMSMTEKQGGSDVRSNTTEATPLIEGDDAAAGALGAPYRLVGHKWFTSAPMSDGFLTLAYTGTGKDRQLSCFLVPRWVKEGERNAGLRFQRLKNKMGDKSNASSEVEYYNAAGFLVGARGTGVRTIVEMVNHTRLDCLAGSAALMQIAVLRAVSHTCGRSAFGTVLRDQPLMQNVLCDLILESEAASALAFRCAAAFDYTPDEAYRRLAVAVGKYYVCKRAPSVVYEALECFGGNGYVEDFPMARYFRQSPLNAIWEGSGNVIVLDVFRALGKPEQAAAAMKAVMAEALFTNNEALISYTKGVISEVEVLLKGLYAAAAKKDKAQAAQVEMQGRVVAERLAIALLASALGGYGDRAVFDAFVESRIVSRPSAFFGTLPPRCVRPEFIDRFVPKLY